MKKTLLTIMLMIIVYQVVNAQVTITGRVSDANTNEDLPGATIQEKGTTNGVVTDIEGKYTITVKEGAVLIISYVGYISQEIGVGSRSIIDVEMQADLVTLNDVVVTAFGIEKSVKSLGFSQTKIDGDELLQAKEVNLVSQLSGKVAGLNITKPNTGVAGSTVVEIRGSSQLSNVGGGRDSPLIVVDGVPIDNTSFTTAGGQSGIGRFGGTDFGDAFTSLNPDDIESINVLKGPSAGTLYGERGAQGVIVITTKKGSKELSIEYNSNFTLDMAANAPDFFQRQYGQGRRGERPVSAIDALNQTDSWGDAFDGTDVTFFDGQIRPYVAAPERDILNYLRDGYTLVNNLAISGGNDLITSRLSVSHLLNEGVIPESEFERYTINSLTSLKYKNKLSLEVKANYSVEDASNRSGAGASGTNPGRAFLELPANISVDILRRNVRNPNVTSRVNSTIPWHRNPNVINPFWAPQENIQEDNKRRLTGYFLAKYQIIDQLSAQFRFAVDWTRLNDFYVDEQGTEYSPQGFLTQGNAEFNDNTLDVILNYNDKLSDSFSLNVNVGAVRNPRNTTVTRLQGRNFIAPEIYHLSNIVNAEPANPFFRERQTNAFYATALLDYQGFIFLDGSIRRDKYSTLTNPININRSDNTALYGSGALSFVLSDIVKLPEFITTAKLRGAHGTAGSGIETSGLLVQAFEFDPFTYIGRNGEQLPAARIQGQDFANPFIKPTITIASEIGLDVRFLESRLGLNLTVYKENAVDQLIRVPLTPFTGFERTLTNAGDIENKGIEIDFDAQIIKNDNFGWDLSFNVARNVNTLISLNDNSNSFNSNEIAPSGAFLRNEVGQQTRQIVGSVLLRDENGRVVHNDAGVPLIAPETQVLGNFTPDAVGGLTNTIRYKNFTIDAVIDFKFGGEILSGSNAEALRNGKHIRTLEGRDNPFFQIIGDGVNEAGEENTTFAFLDQFYSGLSLADEESIFDASFVKLRQVSISYSFPSSLLENSIFKAARISLTGRNLLLLYSGVSELGIDPEAVFNTSSSGFEFATLPTQRSIGFNLFLKF